MTALAVVDGYVNRSTLFVLNVERPETTGQVVEALALRVAEWAFGGLALADDD